jgi:hypothetical protein
MQSGIQPFLTDDEAKRYVDEVLDEIRVQKDKALSGKEQFRVYFI